MSRSKRSGIDLLVCQTCRRTDVENQNIRPGEQLLTLLKNANLSEKVTVTGIDCLGNCKNGCTIVLQAKENGPTCTEISIQGRISNSCVRESLVMSMQTMEKFRGNKECNCSKKLCSTNTACGQPDQNELTKGVVMSDVLKVPVTVITGFLGSGKTTLITQLMRNPNGKRLAVIVNEFGDVGVDGEILKSCAIPDCPAENIMELANGCICCTVADDFIPTIESLMELNPKPEHILIETSGLALPKPLLKAFDWPDIRSRITVDGVIALADIEAVASGQFAPNLAGVEAQRDADES